MLNNLKGVIGVVSHDAGGAEMIAHFIKNDLRQFKFTLEGPAVNVFERVIGEFPNIPLDLLVEESDVLLCGTSWNSSLENRAIYEFKEAGKYSIAILDHYVNYKERFFQNSFNQLPDEIWVTDKFAFEKALEFAGNVKLRIVGNPYLVQQKIEFQKKKSRSSEHNEAVILYLFEPISEHYQSKLKSVNTLGYDEFDAFEYFLKNIHKVAPKVLKIILRPHPSDPVGKYESLATCSNIQIEVSKNIDLLDDLALSDMVVGCESMGLLVATSIGKKVFSSIPPGGYTHDMPFTEVTFIRDLK